MNTKSCLIACVAAVALAPSGFASFHLMQVEQVIGGIDGDKSAQAIQLRMRAPDQDLVSQTRLRAWDATGRNPVIVLNIASSVPLSPEGARILLATASFTSKVKLISPGFTPDFIMTNAIPASYLAAGRLTFETDGGAILWSFAWGGTAYTGSHMGDVFNDLDGNFGPAFPLPLPTASRQAVLFQGPASAMSTTNAANYALSANPATVTKNNGLGFIIGLVPEIVVEQPLGIGLVDGASKKSYGTVVVGSSGKTKTFTIKNIGTAPLTGLKVTKNGTNANDFIVTGPTKASLAPGTRVTFKVSFKPTAKGSRHAAIHIKSNDSNESPFDIPLAGFGALS